MKARIDLTGQRIGRWSVLRVAPTQGRCTFWLCRCDCGVETDVMTQSLRSGASQSCGCLAIELLSNPRPYRETHGMRDSAEYSVYSGIKRRCENKNEACYPRYGGAGVECRFGSFEEFFKEVGVRPSSKHQIDRIDTFGHYEQGNVRWATAKRQARNKKNTRYVTYQGKSRCLADWCDALGLSYKSVWQRLYVAKWSVERAFEGKT